MIPLSLLQKRPQLPNNLHKWNCCERWSILRPWVCWRLHCSTQQVVLEPIGSDLSFCIDKGFLGSGFWQYLRLLNIHANLILSRGHHSVLAISSTVTYVKLIFGWYLTNRPIILTFLGRQFLRPVCLSWSAHSCSARCSSRVAHCPGQKNFCTTHTEAHFLIGFWGFLGILETVCTGINMKRDHVQDFKVFK